MTPQKIFRSVALWLPLAFIALCGLLQAAALPLLPDPIVSQWSLAGEPVSWRPAWEALVSTVVIGTVMTASLYSAGVAAAAHRHHRIFAGLSWMILMLGPPMFTVIVVAQVWTTRLNLGQAFLASLISAMAVAVAAATHLPPFPEGRRRRDPRQWSGATAADRLAPQATIVVAMCALLGASAVVLAALGMAWWVISGPLLVTALSSAQLITIARIDARGVSVRAPLGVPRLTIPLREIESVELTRIEPLTDIGRVGWNARIGPPQEGVAVRAGEGLRIRRTSGVDFLLATDDAPAAERMLGAQLAAERALRQ